MAGKSQGQLWGGIAGGIIGGIAGVYMGNPMLGASLGMAIGGGIGGMVDPPDSDLPDAAGEMNVNLNTYHRNLPVPIVYGIARVGGNILWMGDIKTVVQETGGGKGKPATRKIKYFAKWAIALSEGPISSAGRVWLNDQEAKTLPGAGKAVASTGWSPSSNTVLTPLTAGAGTLAFTLGEEKVTVNMTLYPGDQTQNADPNILAKVPTNPPTFRNVGYALVDASLGETPMIPQISTELAGILAKITGVGIQVCFTGWADQANWTEDFNGDMIRGGDGTYPLWIVDNTQASGYSESRATNVSIDMTGDFDLRFALYIDYLILRTGVTAFSLIFRDKDEVDRGRIEFSGFGFVTPPSGWFGSVQKLGAIVGSQQQDLYRIACAGGNCTTSGDLGQKAEVNCWIRVEKRGDQVRTYYAGVLDNQGDQQSTNGWIELGTAQTYTDGAAQNPFTLGLRVQLMTLWGAVTPAAYIYDFYFCYKSAVSVSAARRGNPALAMYDFLTNDRYGMGIPLTAIDSPSFEKAAAFCDENPEVTPDIPPEVFPPDLLPLDEPADVTEPYEPRFNLDLAITGKRQAADIIADILATCRGFLVWEGGKVYMFIEKIEAATQAFSDDPMAVGVEGLMVRNSFAFQEIDSRQRPNRIKLEYERFDDQYRRDFVIANDQFDQEERGEIIEKVIKLIGIKRNTQARRMAQYFLDLGVNTKWTCSFKVSVAAMKARVGDVVTVTHSVPAWTNKLFRIGSIEEMEDEELELKLVQYIPEIYLDKETDVVIPTTKLIAGDLYETPPNAVRVSAFEAKDDPEKRIYITWSLPKWYELFLDTFLFRKRDSGAFEGQGNFVVDASTAFLTHSKVGFNTAAVAEAPQANVSFTEDFSGTMSLWTEDIQADDDTDVQIVSNEYKIIQNRNSYAHMHRTGLVIPAKFTITVRMKGLLGSGSGWAAAIGIMWDKDDWVQIYNKVTSGANVRIDEEIATVLTTTHPDGTGNGDENWHYYRIKVDDTNITFSMSDDDVIYTQKRQIANFKSGVKPVLTFGLMIGAGNAWGITDVATEFDTNGTLGDPVGTKWVDNVTFTDDSVNRFVVIAGNVTGKSARIYDGADVQLAQAVESGGLIKLDITAQADPFTGYIRVFQDAAYTYDALNGRHPLTGTTSFVHDTRYTYNQTQIDNGNDPTELRFKQLLGTMPSTGDVQTGALEASYTAVVQDNTGDKLTGVTWPNEKLPAVVENRIRKGDLGANPLEDGIAWVEVSDNVWDNRRTKFFDGDAAGVEIFPSNALFICIGSTSRFSAITFLLNRLADVSTAFVLGYSIGGSSYQFWSGKTGEAASQVAHADGTLGMTKSGVITMEPFADWVKTNVAPGGVSFADTTPRYYVSLQRKTATVTTTPKVEKIFVDGEKFLTLQEINNRMDYEYTDDDLSGQVLTFEPMVQSVLGSVGAVARRNQATITIQQYASIPLPPTSPRWNDQTAMLSFIGGDLVVKWEYVSKQGGAGRILAGAGESGGEGAGQPDSPDSDFQKYIMEIWTPDKLTKVRTISAVDVDGTGTATYTETQRQSDNIVGRAMHIKVFIQANQLKSEEATLDLVAGAVSTQHAIGQLPNGLGKVLVPLMSEIDTKLSDLKFQISGLLP